MAMFGNAERTHLSDDAIRHVRSLLETMIFEIVPLKSADPALDALPPNSAVSVTASPIKGLETTIALSDRVRAAGHRPIPHISTRLVEGPDHVAGLARWFRGEGHDTIFVIAGDSEEAVGPYAGSEQFLVDLFALDHGLASVGVAAYPDGHAFIRNDDLHDHLHTKQALFAEAGVASWASTQMCFDTDVIANWIRAERDAGLTMPIHLGIPGVVDRTKLMTMGVRLGVGASLRFLKKNRSVVTRLLAPGSYDPSDIVAPLVADLLALGVDGFHSFTFNQIAATVQWRDSILAESADVDRI